MMDAKGCAKKINLKNCVDTTIVGGGPCGLFAAFYAGLRGMTVRIIDSLPELGGQLTALYPEKYVYDMPGFPKVLARDLAKSLVKQGLQFNPDVLLEQTAVHLSRLENGNYLITTNTGGEYETKTVIVSAGAGAFSPTKLGVEKESEFVNKGIHYGVKSKADFEGKRIGIVGGGDSALDWVINLHDVASTITLIHRRDVFKAHEDSISKAKCLGVPFKLWYTVKEVHGNGKLSKIILEQTQTKEIEELDLDAVIVNIGFKSNLGPIRNWGFTLDKHAIVVDDKYETELPGVFAIGDVCTYGEKLKLIATGLGEAATAVCYAKTYIDPTAKLFPGHSSDRDD